MANKPSIGTYTVYLSILMLMGGGCGGPSRSNKSPADALNVTVPQPQVKHDFKAIKKSEKLRMITRYSSNTYFLHQGRAYGFEYELLKKFARIHHLTLDVVVVRPGQNPYDMLNRGEGDVIAADYAITPVRQRYVDFTHPYNLVNQVVIFSDHVHSPPQTIAGITQRNIPLSVRENSSYYQKLNDIRSHGHPLIIHKVPNSKDTESLLYDVSQGKYAATVVDDNIYQASENYMNNLVRGPVIARHDSIAWAVRKNTPVLKKKMNQFIDQNFRLGDKHHSPKRSAFLNILRRRYFQRGPQIAGYYQIRTSTGAVNQISPYDALFKQIADSTRLDWLMLAAMAAQETKFNPTAKSWTGALGLMQVLPRYSEVDSARMLYNPRTNIQEGARIIRQLLNHYAYLDSTQRWHFALATYNAGQGHVGDARRLVIDLNKNPNQWAPTAQALLKLMNRRYYTKARHGFCRCVETVHYVRDIINRYHTYKSILALGDTSHDNGWPGVLGIFN